MTTWRIPISVLLLLSLAACQTTWTRIDATKVTYSDERYAVDLPTDWVRIKTGEIVFVTRDGISVQHLTIEFREHIEAFKETEQKSSQDMLPSELADRYLAEIRATDENGLPSLEVLSNQPTTINDQQGFELHLRFLNDSGLRYERLVRGFANDEGFFAISYEAPTLHFFERDRAAFDGVVSSFKTI